MKRGIALIVFGAVALLAFTAIRDSVCAVEVDPLLERAMFKREPFFGTEAIVPLPAAEAFEKLERIRPEIGDDPKFLEKIAGVAERLGKFDVAEDAFKRLAAVRKEKAWQLAEFYARRGMFDPVAASQAPASVTPVVAAEEAGLLSALAYYQTLQRMTPVQIARERQVLAALTPTPNTQVRIAMVLGHPRGQPDLARALTLLEAVLKSTDPRAVSLHPLARLLADNYGERQKLEGQLEKQGQQLKDSQRKTIELQEKIDGLADIERTLPQRPRATRPAGVGR